MAMKHQMTLSEGEDTILRRIYYEGVMEHRGTVDKSSYSTLRSLGRSYS